MGNGPVARIEHAARHLPMDGVNVVHQGRRGNNAAEENHHCDQDDDPIRVCTKRGISQIGTQRDRLRTARQLLFGLVQNGASSREMARLLKSKEMPKTPLQPLGRAVVP